MAAFDEERAKTSGKMSDLVMENVSHFIAGDFLEAYERAYSSDLENFVPSEFDDKIYKKITKAIRKKTKRKLKARPVALRLIAALVCAACVAFTIWILLNAGMREQIVAMIFKQY